MSEYFGDAHAVALQRSIRERIGEISLNPLLANGGRVLNVLDPDACGWDFVRQEFDQNQVVALTMVDKKATLARLAAEFDGAAQFPCWDVFTGTAEEVVPVCEALAERMSPPEGWTVTHDMRPGDDLIHTCQLLNADADVTPLPAYYLKGEHIPAMLTCVWRNDGKLVACASASMRYHPEGPLSGYIFAGGVSVREKDRRRGLGSYVNAALIAESWKRFGWSNILEQARTDNLASVGMITRCGLHCDADRATVLLTAGGRYLTR